MPGGSDLGDVGQTTNNYTTNVVQDSAEVETLQVEKSELQIENEVLKNQVNVLSDRFDQSLVMQTKECDFSLQFQRREIEILQKSNNALVFVSVGLVIILLAVVIFVFVKKRKTY